MGQALKGEKVENRSDLAWLRKEKSFPYKCVSSLIYQLHYTLGERKN
jgi:hypothetical protein